MKKIAIIGSAGLPANYGGFETLTHHLVMHLNEKARLTVYCSSKNYPAKEKKFHNAQLVYLPFKPNGVQSILYDAFSILHAIPRQHTLLILGVSGALVLPFIKSFTREKIIIHIDGLEWTRTKWKPYAKMFLKFSEKIAVRFADVIIADNKNIQDYVRETYKKESVLISYGGDHVQHIETDASLKKEYPFMAGPYAFTVCRIEPENNIQLMLETFSRNTKMKLVVVGNWDGQSYRQRLMEKYGRHPNIILLDPVYDPQKLNALRSGCTIYLHGHMAGGTNPSLVEAMSLGLPIAAYDVPYNRTTTGNQALFFKNAEELSDLIGQLHTLPLARIGEALKQEAQHNYRWSEVAGKYLSLF